MEVAQFTCPKCGHVGGIEVPPDNSLQAYRCKRCGELVTTPKGQCCIICAYTNKRCPVSEKRKQL